MLRCSNSRNFDKHFYKYSKSFDTFFNLHHFDNSILYIGVIHTKTKNLGTHYDQIVIFWTKTIAKSLERLWMSTRHLIRRNMYLKIKQKPKSSLLAVNLMHLRYIYVHDSNYIQFIFVIYFFVCVFNSLLYFENLSKVLLRRSMKPPNKSKISIKSYILYTFNFVPLFLGLFEDKVSK